MQIAQCLVGTTLSSPPKGIVFFLKHSLVHCTPFLSTLSHARTVGDNLWYAFHGFSARQRRDCINDRRASPIILILLEVSLWHKVFNITDHQALYGFHFGGEFSQVNLLYFRNGWPWVVCRHTFMLLFVTVQWARHIIKAVYWPFFVLRLYELIQRHGKKYSLERLWFNKRKPS